MSSAFCITCSLERCWNGFSRAKLMTSHNVTANDQTVLGQVYLSWNVKRLNVIIEKRKKGGGMVCVYACVCVFILIKRNRIDNLLDNVPIKYFPTRAIWLEPRVVHLCRCSLFYKGHCTLRCLSPLRCNFVLAGNFSPPNPYALDFSIPETSYPMLFAVPCKADSFDWKDIFFLLVLLFLGMYF